MNTETLIVLEQAIEPYRQAGYTVISQNDLSITLVGQPRPFSYVGFLAGLLLFWPVAILYLITYNQGRDTSVCLRITSQGYIEASGYTLSLAAREHKRSKWIQILVAAVFILMLSLLIIVLIIRAN